MPAVPLGGWVLDRFHQAVAGAKVQVEPLGRAPDYTRRSTLSGRATSAPDGSFWIGNALYNSSYRLTVEAPSFAPMRQDLPAFERSAPADPIQVVLTKGRQVWGTIADPKGAPVSGARVRLLWPSDAPELGANWNSREAVGPAWSNTAGEFEFPLVAAGAYGLEISHREYADLQGGAAVVPPGDGYVDLGVFPLAAGLEVHGVVIDPERRPVPGAKILARQRTAGLSAQERSATTDGDGRFRLGGLLPALADVTAVADGYAASVVESVRPATSDPLTIELAEGASLAGLVLAPDGTAAAGVEVELSPSPASVRTVVKAPTHSVYRRSRTDEGGRFVFRDVLPATWTVAANGEGAVAMQDQIEIGNGEWREIELQMRIPDRLIVRVTNHVGEPVARAHVAVRSEDRDGRRSLGSTDAGGLATLWISPGRATVKIDHPFLLERSRDIVLVAGVNEVDVKLSPGWEIQGAVRSAHGAPLPGVVVAATGTSSDLEKELAGEQEWQIAMRRTAHLLLPGTKTVAGVGGAFRLTGLDRGGYRLVARLAGYTEGNCPSRSRSPASPSTAWRSSSNLEPRFEGRSSDSTVPTWRVPRSKPGRVRGFGSPSRMQAAALN